MEELQQVKVTLVLDVPAHADAVTYFIGQVGTAHQGWALVECFEDSQDWHPAWSVASSFVEVVK